jgi:tetratricopeptide (TPR) repeat protein
MAKARMRTGLLTGCLVLFGTATTAQAAPTVAQMLSFRPRQEGIEYTTPAPEEQARCKVELVKAGRASGWLLKDEKGEALRRYMDTNGDNKIDVWSYYHKGAEVYREIDSNFNDKVDQYRWLTSAGSKWGLDPQEDGKVKTWKVISPEEVSQEVFAAVLKRDPARIQALLLTEAEIKMLELPAAEANRIRESIRRVPARFQETLAKLSGQTDKARWDHVELAPPQCLPVDSTGMKQDLVRYVGAIVFYSTGEEGKGPVEAKGLLLGEMIQVGSAWRIIDAPVPGSPIREQPGAASSEGIVMNKELEGHYAKLGALDKNPPGPESPPAQLRQWNLDRATVLEQMIALVGKLDPGQVKPEDRDNWTRQVADCLAAAAQNSPEGDKTAYDRLVALKDRIIKEQPETSLAAYVGYTEIMTDYNVRIVDKKSDGVLVQKELLERLSKFVQDHPRADNAPDALEQLGMISELMGEDAQAKKWYETFVKTYPTHPKAAKMNGARERLDLKGKDLVLAGPTLTGSPFDVRTLKNKIVVVYYWASWNQQSADDLAKLKTLQGTYASKGLEVICVNLDSTAEEAKRFLAGKLAPTTHLFEPGGLSSKLGEQYGILVLPTMFLVGKDGKVISAAEQMTTIESSIKKVVN